MIAMIKGTDAETVISVLEKIGLNKRKTVREVTLDLSPTMKKIARRVLDWYKNLLYKWDIDSLRKLEGRPPP